MLARHTVLVLQVLIAWCLLHGICVRSMEYRHSILSKDKEIRRVFVQMCAVSVCVCVCVCVR